MLERRIRRALRPLRPVLLPIWDIVDRRANPHATKPGGSFPAPANDRPIWPISKTQFDRLSAGEPYYARRRRYIGAAAWVAADLIERYALVSALELGPNVRPLIVGADVMDLVERSAHVTEGRFIQHDARRTPWPIEDRRYDLFVALQVFEHLGASQAAAFAEVRRVARHAVLSLPIDWQMEDQRNPHHGLSHERALSWFAPIIPTRVFVGNPGSAQRLIYVFEKLTP